MADELYMQNREVWHKWLEKNNGACKEVWLVYYKKHTEKPCVSYDDSVEEALCFGWIDSILKRIDDDKFVRKFTPRKGSSRWSELNKKRAEKMLKEGRMTQAGLKCVKEAKETGEWSKNPVKMNTLDVPVFMQQALEKNKKALLNFNNLAPSYRKQYVGWISSAKKEETRLRRLAEALGYLERNERLPLK